MRDGIQGEERDLGKIDRPFADEPRPNPALSSFGRSEGALPGLEGSQAPVTVDATRSPLSLSLLRQFFAVLDDWDCARLHPKDLS